MSSYSEYIKSVKENQKTKFFGEVKNLSNKYFTFNHIINEDSFIIITENVKFIKENPVMIISENKAVYLKEFNLMAVHNYDFGINGYAVKLNRKFFKPYTFKNSFEDFEGMEEDTFDSLMNVAKTQDMPIAIGHMN